MTQLEDFLSLRDKEMKQLQDKLRELVSYTQFHRIGDFQALYSLRTGSLRDRDSILYYKLSLCGDNLQPKYCF